MVDTPEILRPTEQRYTEMLRRYNDGAFHPGGYQPAGYDPQLIADLERAGLTSDIASIPALVSPPERLSSLIDPNKLHDLIITDRPWGYDKLWISAVPLSFLSEHASELVSRYHGLVLAEYEHGAAEPSYQALHKNGLGIHTFKHPTLKTDASYSLLKMEMDAKPLYEAWRPGSLAEVIQDARIPSMDIRGKSKLTRRLGGHFTPNEEEQLVALFKDRFDGISQNMPIRLDVSDEETLALLQDPAYIFVTSRARNPDPGREDTITGCVFFTDQPRAYPWIDQRFLLDRVRETDPYNLRPYNVFVPGVAKLNDNLPTTGRELMADFYHVIHATGQKKVFAWYECTDVSKRLVLPGAKREMSALFAGDVEEVGRKTFVLLELPS